MEVILGSNRKFNVCDLAVGDIFDDNGKIYMRIENNTAYLTQDEVFTVPVVNLQTGHLNRYKGNTAVKKIHMVAYEE
jgi:hypothetical protein